MKYQVIEVDNCYDAERLQQEINDNITHCYSLVSVVPNPEKEHGYFLVFCRE